jgi:hypothetical protein
MVHNTEVGEKFHKKIPKQTARLGPGCFRKFDLMVMLFLVVFPATAVSETILNIKPTAETQDYLLGENVYFFLDACNPTDSPYTETFSCPCCIFKLTIVDHTNAPIASYDDGAQCPQNPVQLNWKPKGCLSLGPFTWLQTRGGFPVPGDGDQIPPGKYYIKVKWENGPLVKSDPIVILRKQTLPAGSIDSRAIIIFIVLLVAGAGCIIFFLRRQK